VFSFISSVSSFVCVAREERAFWGKEFYILLREILKVLQAATVYHRYTQRERVFDDDDENDE